MKYCSSFRCQCSDSGECPVFDTILECEDANGEYEEASHFIYSAQRDDLVIIANHTSCCTGDDYPKGRIIQSGWHEWFVALKVEIGGII